MSQSQKFSTPQKNQLQQNQLKQSMPLRNDLIETQLETPKENRFPINPRTFNKKKAQLELERDLAMSEVQLKDQMKIQQIEIDGEFGMGDPELSRQQEETLYQSMFEHQKLMDDSKTFFDPEVIRG